MTLLLALKLFLAPLFVWIISLLQGRYSARMGGLFLGLPLTTGPFLLIVGIQEGRSFAKTAAHGVLVGQLSLIVFCFAYALAAGKLTWDKSIAIATVAVWISGYVFNLIDFSDLGVILTLFFVWAIALGVTSSLNYSSAFDFGLNRSCKHSGLTCVRCTFYLSNNYYRAWRLLTSAQWTKTFNCDLTCVDSSVANYFGNYDRFNLPSLNKEAIWEWICWV